MKKKYIITLGLLIITIFVSFLLNNKIMNKAENKSKVIADNKTGTSLGDGGTVTATCTTLDFGGKANRGRNLENCEGNCFNGIYPTCGSIIGNTYDVKPAYKCYEEKDYANKVYQSLYSIYYDENTLSFNIDLKGGKINGKTWGSIQFECGKSSDGNVDMSSLVPTRDKGRFIGFSTDGCKNYGTTVPVNATNLEACYNNQFLVKQSGCYKCKERASYEQDSTTYYSYYHYLKSGRQYNLSCDGKPYSDYIQYKETDACVKKDDIIYFYVNETIVDYYWSSTDTKAPTAKAEKRGYIVTAWSKYKEIKEMSCNIKKENEIVLRSEVGGKLYACLEKKASSNGCYFCGNSDNYSCNYYSEGQTIGDDCITLVPENVCYQTGQNKCEKTRTAEIEGCYECSSPKQIYTDKSLRTGLRYFSVGDNLSKYGCEEKPSVNQPKYVIGGYCTSTPIILNANTGHFKNNVETKSVGCTLNGAGECTFDVNGDNPTREGYKLYGWSKTSYWTGCKWAFDADELASTYYACWKSVEDEEDVTTPTDPKNQEVNAYRYVMDDAFYQGENVSCSDKVYVTKCDDTYCEVSSINGTNTSTTTLVYKSKISTSDTLSNCSSKVRYIKENGYYYSDKDLSKDEKSIGCAEEVKLVKSLGDACDGTVCEVSINDKNVFLKQELLVTTKPTCSVENNTVNNVIGITGTTIVQITYTKNKGELTEQRSLESAVTCADGYDKQYYMVSDSDTCKNVESGTCSKNYKVSCVPKLKPKVSATGSTVKSNGLGTISFRAEDPSNVGIKGYFISNGESPTINSNWMPFTDSTYTATKEYAPGTYYIWVINNEDVISYSVMVRIMDTDTSNTLSTLGVKSEGGTDYSMTRTDPNSGDVALADKTIKYVRLANELKTDSTLAGFESLATGYEVTVKESKISVYATLTSADASYVDGYAPRTVDLDYGRNVILIKILNKQGRVRTYTIIANRVDDRESNNLLSEITVSKGKIEFDSYTSNYEVMIPKGTTEVEIKATLDSNNSKYVSGYTPGKVKITEDETSKVIKVISNAGIVRSYVITFIRSGAKLDTSVNSSVYLSSISAPGTGLTFDKYTDSYTVTVPYEVEEVPVNAYAESENATVDVVGNYNFKVGTNAVEITVTNGNRVRVYTIYVIRKQDGLEVTSDTTLSTLTVKGYNIGFKPDVFDYAVKIRREKSLIITATPLSNRSEVYMYGNNDLTGFSTVRVKVIAENGDTGLYSIDIQKDAFNERLEKILSIGAIAIAVIGSGIILIRKKNKKKREYLGE